MEHSSKTLDNHWANGGRWPHFLHPGDGFGGGWHRICDMGMGGDGRRRPDHVRRKPLRSHARKEACSKAAYLRLWAAAIACWDSARFPTEVLAGSADDCGGLDTIFPRASVRLAPTNGPWISADRSDAVAHASLAPGPSRVDGRAPGSDSLPRRRRRALAFRFSAPVAARRVLPKAPPPTARRATCRRYARRR